MFDKLKPHFNLYGMMYSPGSMFEFCVAALPMQETYREWNDGQLFPDNHPMDYQFDNIVSEYFCLNDGWQLHMSIKIMKC